MKVFGLPPKQSVALRKDFFKEDMIDVEFLQTHPGFAFEGTPVMIMAGLTLSNMEGFPEDGLPRGKVVGILRRWHENLQRAYAHSCTYVDSEPQSRPHLLISIDPTQDKDIIQPAYEGQAEFTKNFAHRLRRDAPVTRDFDPLAFDVDYPWYPQSHVITHDLMPLRGMDLIDNVPTHLEKGGRYIVNNTYKWPLPVMTKMASDAGFRQRAVFTDLDGRIHLLCFEAVF
jgi:hypothetical protein